MDNYSDGENTDDEHVHILSGFLIKARRFETDTIYSAHIQSDKEVEGKGADVEVGCEYPPPLLLNPFPSQYNTSPFVKQSRLLKKNSCE